MESEIRKRTLWSGEHLGIPFEVQLYTRPEYSYRTDTREIIGEKECWTFYLYLFPDAMPDDVPSIWLEAEPVKDSRHVAYDYSSHPVLANIDWHCGLTWYSKEHGFDGSRRCVKVGCDYQHYWDEGRTYFADYVIDDARRAAESFRELVPGYKWRCYYNGRYYPVNEGEVKENGKFLSHEGKTANEEWMAKNGASEAPCNTQS